MKVLVIGLGYVGLTNAAYLAQFHHVIGFDIDYQKLNDLQQGKDYLDEPGVMVAVKRHRHNLTFVDAVSKPLSQADIVLIAVPTPEGIEGQANLNLIDGLITPIIQQSKQSQIIVVRSTVPPGTIASLQTIANQHKRDDLTFVFVPEFLSLGQAMKEMRMPKRVVIGTHKPAIEPTIRKLFNYHPRVPYVITDPQTAELTKYAANGFLATKISYINEIAQIAESVGANIQTVVKGMAFDPRIGPLFMQPGIGFGGNCLPKDLKALKHVAKKHRIPSPILEATLQTNNEQTIRFVNRILDRFHHQINQKKIAILGLSYKGSTSDVSNSLAFKVVDMLTDKGAMIFAYDKKATFSFFSQRGEKPCLAYANLIEDALQDAEMAIILNDAIEIQSLKARDFKRLMKTPIVFDGRNLYDPALMKGVEYHSIGRPTSK